MIQSLNLPLILDKIQLLMFFIRTLLILFAYLYV